MREMKPSAMEWIGDIPPSWKVMPNKYLMRKKKEICPVYNGEDILSLTMKGVIVRDLDAGGKMPASFDGYQRLEPGNLLMCLFDIDVTPRCIGLIKQAGLSSPAYSQFVLSDGADAAYYCYYYTMLDNDKTLLHLAKNLRHSLTEDQLGAIPVIVPPTDEQHRIADFLDAKCAEIDALTADIQTQIDILEQYKRSVITETVTKGMNPDAEMKDSGIDGARITPSHWKTTRLCYECYIRARLGWRGLKADEYVEEGYAFISAFNIQNGKLVWTPLNYITKERFDESPEIKLHTGDVLIVKDGAGVGKCARVDELPMGGTAPNSSIAVITPSENQDYRYVCYYLQSSVFNNFVLLLYNGMGVPHLTQEIMSKIKILVPPLKEQMEISDYLDTKCAEIDTIVEIKKAQLATLDEYKKSLIFEYVTGKKEVPIS